MIDKVILWIFCGLITLQFMVGVFTLLNKDSVVYVCTVFSVALVCALVEILWGDK